MAAIDFSPAAAGSAARSISRSHLEDDTERAKRPMKVLIADDHWVVREAMTSLMKRVYKSLRPFEAASFDDAVAILDENPDIELMLVDLIMPGFAEFAGLRMLRKRYPAIPIVVISVHEDRSYVMRAIQQGVVGYIPKTAEPHEMQQALALALSGQVSYPRRILESLDETPEPVRKPVVSETIAPATVGVSLPDRSLTSREQDVLDLLGSGASVHRIAEELQLSPNTVRVHVSNIMRKLQLRDRTQVIHYAVSRKR